MMSYSSINCLDDFCQKETQKMKYCAAHNCGKKFCSYDKQTCTDFITWGVRMKSVTTNIKHLKIYKYFVSRIKKCENYDYRNQWSHRLHFGW